MPNVNRQSMAGAVKTKGVGGAAPVVKQRVQGVRVGVAVLQRWITEGNVISHEVVKGMPPGSEVLSVKIDGPNSDILITFTHPSLPEVEQGAPFPEILAQFRDLPNAD